ncbi:GPW/gp25 family protein [Massilia sp. W12]|uniref:GPW/gp25 family protein n=1 Tax=Massilia sp. W12 TaxID=3126507 RepID=UPI0030CD72EE
MMRDLAFPFQLQAGRTARADWAAHVRQMLEQLIFTNQGERLHRPDFGSGVLQLLFAPNSPELAATLQFSLQAAITRWLGDVLQVQSLQVHNEESELRISISYLLLRDGSLETAEFRHPK